MLQRTFPAGFIAPCLPTKTDETPTVSVETPETPETPFARAPFQDNFAWNPENGAVIVPSQEAIAIYRNPWGQVVTRAEKADDGSRSLSDPQGEGVMTILLTVSLAAAVVAIAMSAPLADDALR